MMEQEKLRKADLFSGGIIFLFGLWIISQALKMPMKDSWGGVQNVWFVSPALFPLFVGAMISLLGALLIRTAIRAVGIRGFSTTLQWLMSSDLLRFLNTAAMVRFYTIVVLFFSLVYLMVPRVDFFLAAVLFLSVFISGFYFDDDALLRKILTFYLAGTVVQALFFGLGLDDRTAAVLAYPGDWLTLAFILAYCGYAWTQIRGNTMLRRKFRTTLILSIVAPFFIGPVFKYLLLVPMPTEGLVVAIMDAIVYWDF